MANSHNPHPPDLRADQLAPEDIDRFWSKVDKTGDCWNWLGATIPQGYGTFWIRGKNRRSHRVAWVNFYGDIPDGLIVCHRCDNPSCVNPFHMFLGTWHENALDRERKGRGRRFIGSQHPNARLTESDVIEIREAYSEGQITLNELAARYGISFQHVSEIVNYKKWRHLR